MYILYDDFLGFVMKIYEFLPLETHPSTASTVKKLISTDLAVWWVGGCNL